MSIENSESLSSLPSASACQLEDAQVTPDEMAEIIQVCNEIQHNFSVSIADARDKLKISKFKSGFINQILLINLEKIVNQDKRANGQTKNENEKCDRTSSSSIPPFDRFVLKLYSDIPLLFFKVIDSKISTLLAAAASQENVLRKRRLAPEVYLMRDRSIAMQMIEGHALTCADDCEPEMRRQLAQKLAQFHALQVPTPRNTAAARINEIFCLFFSPKLWHSINRGAIRRVLDEPFFRDHCYHCQSGRDDADNDAHVMIGDTLRREADYVHHLIRRRAADLPIVFSHRDLNHSNILIENNTDKIYFIDFDLSCYMYRGYDIGRYFVDAFQSDQFHAEPLLSDSLMLEFAQWYCEESVRLRQCDDRNQVDEQISYSPKDVVREAKIFVLLAYMIDVIFCMWQASLCLERDDDEAKMSEINGFANRDDADETKHNGMVEDNNEDEAKKSQKELDPVNAAKVIDFLAKGVRRFAGYFATKRRFQLDQSID